MSTCKETEGDQSGSTKSSSDASGNVEKDDGLDSGAASKDTSNGEQEAKTERIHSESDVKEGVSRSRRRSSSKPLTREEVQNILRKCYPYNQYRRQGTAQRERTPPRPKRVKEDDNDYTEGNEDTEENDQAGNQEDGQCCERERNRHSCRNTERKSGKSQESDDSLECSVRGAQKTKKRRRRRQRKSRKRGAQQEDLMEGLPDEQEETQKLSETSTRRGYRQTPISQRERENAEILRMVEINRRREEAKHRMKRLREKMQKLREERRVTGHPRDETGDDEDSKDRAQKKSRRNKDNVLPLPLRGHADTKQYGESGGGRCRRSRGINRVEVLVLPRRIKRSRSSSPRWLPRKKRKRAMDEAVYPKFRRVPRKQTDKQIGGEHDVEPVIPRVITRRSRPNGRTLHPSRLRRLYQRRKGGVADDSRDTKKGICEDNVHGAHLKRKNPDSVHYARIPRKRRRDDNMIEMRMPTKREEVAEWLDNNEGSFRHIGREEVDLRNRRQGKRNENVLKELSRNVRRKRDRRCRNRYPAVSTNIKSEKTVAKEDPCLLERNRKPMRTLRMTPRLLQQLEELSSSEKKQEELKRAPYVHGSLSSIGLEFITPSETDDEATNAENTHEKTGVNSLEAGNKLHLNRDIFVNKSINPTRAVPLYKNAAFRNASKESDFSAAIAKKGVLLRPTPSTMERHSLVSTTSSYGVPNEYTFQPFVVETSGKELTKAASRVFKNSETLRRCRPRSTKANVYESGEKRRRTRKAITCYYDSETSSDDDQPCPLCQSRKRRPCDEYREICRQRNPRAKRKKRRRYPLMMVPIPSINDVTKPRRRRAQLHARMLLRGKSQGIKCECGEEDEVPAAKARARRRSHACVEAARERARARAEAEDCTRCAELAELRAAKLRRSRRLGEADGEQCDNESRRTRRRRSSKRPCKEEDEEDDDDEEEIVIHA